VEPEPPPLTLGVVVFDFQTDRGTNPGERVDEDADQGAIAETTDGFGLDGVEELTSFLAREERCLAALHDVSWTAHCTGRIRWHDLTDDQPIEEHSDGGEVLLHRRLGVSRTELLDVRRDERRSQLLQSPDISFGTPAEEIVHGYARRVFAFRMFAVKNSMKRQDARSPAASIGAGNCSKPILVNARFAGVLGGIDYMNSIYDKGRYHIRQPVVTEVPPKSRIGTSRIALGLGLFAPIATFPVGRHGSRLAPSALSRMRRDQPSTPQFVGAVETTVRREDSSAVNESRSAEPRSTRRWIRRPVKIPPAGTALHPIARPLRGDGPVS